MTLNYFVTGATGLVGGALVKSLAHQGANVIAHARDVNKAHEMLMNLDVSITTGQLEDRIDYPLPIDYIIHAAAPTSSSFFIERPVETIDSILMGTKRVLELAREKNVASVVFLSSMEVYGTPNNEEVLTEDRQFYLNPLTIRSNYPLAKRMAENMCVAYSSEYGVPVKIARLAQVIGNKLLRDDNRAIAQFIRSARKGKDIELATDGMARQTYVGIDDAVSGILTVLHNGQDATAYNIGNDEAYCSIFDLATTIAQEVNFKVNVRANVNHGDARYPPNRTLRINSDRLHKLGWRAKTDLTTALKTLLDSETDS